MIGLFKSLTTIKIRRNHAELVGAQIRSATAQNMRKSNELIAAIKFQLDAQQLNVASGRKK